VFVLKLFFSSYARDVVGQNFAGIESGFYLADKKICFWGQSIALVVATSQQAALSAAALVKVHFFKNQTKHKKN
jgi:xanthine dehydrogenase molybdopterin-binding subunit B